MTTAHTISERIRQLLARQGLEPSPFAESISIGKANFSRLLRGERRWNLDHLEKVARGLGVTVGDLTSKIKEVVVVREISASDSFTFPLDLRKESPLGKIPAPSDVDDVSAMYALHITDNSYAPWFLESSCLICQKDTSDTIKTGDFVVYCCPDGSGRLGRVEFLDDKILLDQLISPHAKLLLDRSQKKMMDRVMYVKL